MVEVRWTAQSIEDIENIAEYIAKDSPKFASLQTNLFFKSVAILENFPKAGRMVPELGNKKVRELIEKWKISLILKNAKSYFSDDI